MAKRTNEKAAIAARLSEALDHRAQTDGMNRTKLAELVGMRKTSITDILNGGRSPSGDSLTRIMQVLRVWPNYAILGVPPKYHEDASEPHPEASPPVVPGIERWLAQYRGDLTDAERAWLRAFPWKSPDVLEPDHVYLMALAIHRQSSSR